MSHLDELFEKNFHDKFHLLEQEWLEFQASNEHWTKPKIYKEMLIRLRKERNGMAESKWKNIGDPTISSSLSEYKNALFNWFQSHHNDYTVDAVHHFMQEHYPKLKEKFLINFLVVPNFSPEIVLQLSEFNLSEEEVIEQLAHHEAILEFIKKLESFSTNEKKATSFADKVSNLFADSRHDEAFELFIEHLRNASSPLLDEIIILKSRYTESQNKFRKGLISYPEESSEVAKITNSALAVLRVFERENP